MTRKPIHTDQAPKVLRPYSQAIRTDALLFASGQIGIDPATGELTPGGVAEQTSQVLDNLGSVLAAGGSSLAQVVKTMVFLQDMTS